MKDSGNIKIDFVDTVVFNLYQIRQRNFSGDTQYYNGMTSFKLSNFVEKNKEKSSSFYKAHKIF